MMEPDSNSESEGVSNSNNELLSSTNEDKSSPKVCVSLAVQLTGYSYQ